MSFWLRYWGRGLIGAAWLGLFVVVSGCVSDVEQPPGESYERNNVAFGAFVALVIFGVAAIWAAGRTKNIASRSRWSVPALVAIGLTLIAPVVFVGASFAMY